MNPYHLFIRTIRRFVRNEHGRSPIEYALIIGMAVSALWLIGSSLSGTVSQSIEDSAGQIGQKINDPETKHTVGRGTSAEKGSAIQRSQ